MKRVPKKQLLMADVLSCFTPSPEFFNSSTSKRFKWYYHFFSEERLREIHKKGFGLIYFGENSNKDALDRYLTKEKSQDNAIIGLEPSQNNSFIWDIERPRTGFYLIKNESITESNFQNYLNQSKKILKYLEEVIPEFTKSNFHLRCYEELMDNWTSIETMCRKREYKKANIILSRLMVNQNFRPNFSEIFQYSLLSHNRLKKKVVKDDLIITNSLSKEQSAFIEFGITSSNKIGIFEISPDVSKFSSSSTSVIMSIDMINELFL